MSNSDLRTKVLEKIQDVPEDQLDDLYQLVHSFLLNTASNHAPQDFMKFAGCWNDIPDGIYTEWLDDISLRRQQAFSQRQIVKPALINTDILSMSFRGNVNTEALELQDWHQL